MKIAVYTSVFGDKDEIKDPLNYITETKIDYFLITDNYQINSLVYNIILKKPFYDDITKNARYYKINGLEIFEKYDYVIWHDANLQIWHDKIQNVIPYVENNQIAFFKHPDRNCIYDEAIKCIEFEKDDPLKIVNQILQYYNSGIENDIGLYETSILVKNNKLICKDFLKLWWNEIKLKSRRDQLSLPYSLKRFKVEPGIIQGDRLNNPYSFYHEHKHFKYNFSSKGKPKLIFPISKALSIKIIKFFKKINV